jgi:hypothetical protein
MLTDTLENIQQQVLTRASSSTRTLPRSTLSRGSNSSSSNLALNKLVAGSRSPLGEYGRSEDFMPGQ